MVLSLHKHGRVSAPLRGDFQCCLHTKTEIFLLFQFPFHDDLVLPHVGHLIQALVNLAAVGNRLGSDKLLSSIGVFCFSGQYVLENV